MLTRKFWFAGLFAAHLLCLGPFALAQSRPPNIDDLKHRLLQYKKSGSYERDVAAVLTSAQRFIERRAGKTKRPAIVLDVDETSLSNWPELVANDFGYIPNGPCDSLPAGPCGVRAWELSARGEVISPTLALFKAAKAKGVAVFFITGRPENERAATEENLHKAGYDSWDGLSLRPVGNIAAASIFKAAERARIVADGFVIIANIGDQPSDLSGGYAERTFLIPNPFYRVP